ncbi:DUF5979 domain-containing protein [Actinomyces qiguomingii]|uniref:DUF5979 domain-containing protein n=1 Tax=Actinomyces qiguomingii TaxID=2057800 RepID=UPI001E2CAE94|nr:DUF5979 domain-containing protein [Actinomyces qiguomingii]
MPSTVNARAVGRAAAVAVAVMALLFGFVTPLQARAAVNEGIAINDLKLVKSDRDGNNAAGALTTQDVAKLSYSWDATGATVNPGDSFSIDLGAYFKNLESPKTVPMNVTYNGAQTEIGSCTLTEKTIECTFSESVTALKNAGFTNFKGSGEALLLITQTTDAKEVDMTINGSKKVSVSLPGSGGISGVQPVVYTPFKLTKMSAVINSTSSSMIWEINFGSDYIKEQLAGGANPIQVDGTTRQTITFTDTLGSGMSFGSDMSRWYFMVRNSAAEPSLPGVNVTNAAGTDLNTNYGDFDMTVSIKGQVATITVTGPFAARTNYKISYPVTFTSQSGKAIAGVQYGNSASLNDSGAEGEFTRSYTDSFKVTVQMDPGFGGFEILKTLSGPGVDAVDVAGTTLPVTVAYTLPGPASSYDGWDAPGTLNDDGVTGTTTMSVSIGKTNTYPATFPQGTVITLSEDTAGASLQPQGYVWGSPIFRVGNQETATLTIVDRTSTQVTLNNVAEEIPGTFQVRKEISGLDGVPEASQKDFTFTYTCSDGKSGTVTAKGDGQAVQADQTFAPGTTCEVTENADSAQVDGYSLSAPESQTVTIAAPTEEEPAVTASFTNTYTRDTGSFSVVKLLQGGPEGNGQTSFSINYTCDDGTQGTLSVPGDGTEVESPKIPTGATCTLSEDAASAAREGYSVDVSLSPESVTIGKDRISAVTVTNTYTRDTGSFSVLKKVEGDYSPTDEDSVKVSYTCNDPADTSGTLELPMDGTPVSGPTLPTGTECKLQEDANSAAREGYSVATSYSDTSVTVVKGSTPSVTVTNNYERLTGGFAISKTVEGDGALLAPAEFTFTYTCTDELTGQATGPEEVTVSAGESVNISGVKTGSCKVSEKDASVAGTSVSTLLTVNGKAVDGDAATFDVTSGDEAAVAVSATNTYTLERGTFSVSKAVEGDGSDAISKRSFVFDYTCTSVEGEHRGEILVPGDGTITASGLRLPLGAECTVTERSASAQVEGYDVVTPQAQSLTISEKDTTKALSFTNTYTRHTGSFSVLKTVTGAQAGDKEFTFSYSCTNDEKGALTAKADGQSVSGPKLPTGTQCTITEDQATAELDGYSLTAPAAQTVTISEKDEVVATTFTNAYTEIPAPTPKPSEPTPSATPVAPGPSLARTGIAVGLPIALALAGLVGGVILVRRRRA